MAVTPKRPITPAQRGMTSRDFSELDSQVKTPTKLKKAKQRISGRNAHGRITVRRRGGGSKRFYRLIQDLPKGKAEVISIDYDPNRSAHIALLQTDKEQVYVLASKDMKVGEKIEVGNAENVSSTNRLALKDIPNGTAIYNIELEPGKGGQMVKSAGASAQIVAKEEGQIQVKLPSG